MIGRAFRVAVAGACVLSLLLCLGAGWLWWRSYKTCFSFDMVTERGWKWHASTTPARVRLLADELFPDTRLGYLARYPHPQFEASPQDDNWRRIESQLHYDFDWAGLGIDHEPPTTGFTGVGQRFYRESWDVGIRWPYACTYLALPPLLWLGTSGRRRLVARRRRRMGWCVGCGYDLTGNESGVCPECGAGAAHR